LTYEDLRLLVAIADNRGYPLYELPYMIMDSPETPSKGIERDDLANAVEAMNLIDKGIKGEKFFEVRTDIDKLNFSRVMKKKNEGELSNRIKRLESEGWIVRTTRERQRPSHGPKPCGPKIELPIYINPKKYEFIEMIFHDKLKVLRKELKSMDTEILQKARATHLDGTSSEFFVLAPRVPESSLKYRRISREFWKYAYLHKRWRVRIKRMESDSNRDNHADRS
jgi:hypothetical protein